MSEEEIQDIRKRVIRLVDQFDYALTVDQLHMLVKRQIPKVASVEIIEVIHEVADNGDLPPGKYILLPNSIIKKTVTRVSAPVLENATIPTASTVTTFYNDIRMNNGTWDETVFSLNVGHDTSSEEIIEELTPIVEDILTEEEEMIEDMDISTEEWDDIGKRAHKFQEMVLYHKDFKAKLDSLITRALDILTEEEALTGRDLTMKLGLDITKKAHQLAINVVYESLLPYIVEDD